MAPHSCVPMSRLVLDTWARPRHVKKSVEKESLDPAARETCVSYSTNIELLQVNFAFRPQGYLRHSHYWSTAPKAGAARE